MIRAREPGPASPEDARGLSYPFHQRYRRQGPRTTPDGLEHVTEWGECLRFGDSAYSESHDVDRFICRCIGQFLMMVKVGRAQIDRDFNFIVVVINLSAALQNLCTYIQQY